MFRDETKHKVTQWNINERQPHIFFNMYCRLFNVYSDELVHIFTMLFEVL